MLQSNFQPMDRTQDMDSDAPEKPSGTRRLARTGGSLFRLAMKIVLILVFIGGGFLVGGFLNFSRTIADYQPPQNLAAADGIVVLTGGSARISTALSLLEDKKGQRLLITGVNRHTNIDDIEKLNASHKSLFECCVDSEDIATDTIGNAAETAKWADNRGYKSLVIVTSGYHMPRSMLEFTRQMPNVALTGYAVQSNLLTQPDWWKNTDTLRLVMSEYLKFVIAHVRGYVSAETFAALRSTLKTV